MTLLLEARWPRTLEDIVRRFGDGSHRGERLEAWVFEGEETRREAEARLRQAGVAARVRSAYKPLVHAFLEESPGGVPEKLPEEIRAEALWRVEIVYPVHPAADPRRFQLEAYPLAAMLGQAELVFLPGGEDLTYRVRTERPGGAVVTTDVFAPNRAVPNRLGGCDLVPTGWLRVSAAGDDVPAVDEPLETEIEALFRRVADAVAAHGWQEEAPYFERLSIVARVPLLERRLPVGEEVLSTGEALHEDLYFTALEILRRHAGLAIGDRSLQPGQIVPEVTAAADDATVRVALESYGEPHDRADEEADDIEACSRAPALSSIRRELEALPGVPIRGRSVEGRPIPGLYRAGPGPAVLLTGGQHANETSGVVGALRAARRLLRAAEPHLALIPVENPDGYALHRRLCIDNPRHMHHAARYTALGNDLDQGCEDRLSEIKTRREAIALCGAGLHINLHGYPAHEWTRPFSGYLPRGFETWSLPKGFLLIMRHHPGLAAQARRLVEAVALALGAVPGLLAFNARQIALCEVHGGEIPGERIGGVPCVISEDARHPTPLTLITEFPDETVEGDAFRFAHTVQMAAAVAAVAGYAAIVATSAAAVTPAPSPRGAATSALPPR